MYTVHMRSQLPIILNKPKYCFLNGEKNHCLVFTKLKINLIKREYAAQKIAGDRKFYPY